MTIHAAKGLEWPVVVIPDLARGYPSESHPVLFDPDLGVAVNFGEDDGEPVLYRLIADRKLRAREAEARRLFYVACTRARDHLILTSTEGITSRFCGLTLLQPGLEVADISYSPVPFRPEDAQPPELPTPSPRTPSRLLLESVNPQSYIQHDRSKDRSQQKAPASHSVFRWPRPSSNRARVASYSLVIVPAAGKMREETGASTKALSHRQSS